MREAIRIMSLVVGVLYQAFLYGLPYGMGDDSLCVFRTLWPLWHNPATDVFFICERN